MLELISIVMPAYNAAQYIEQSIESVLKQSYTNWELIIVDDCSVDDTYKIVEKLCLNEERIKLFRMNENSGVAMARNFAISMSRGKYIAFLDSDDLWLPDKLEKQLNLMREKKRLRGNFCRVPAQPLFVYGEGLSFYSSPAYQNGRAKRRQQASPASGPGSRRPFWTRTS